MSDANPNQAPNPVPSASRSPRARLASVLSQGGLSVLAAVAIAVMVNYLSFRHFERWDVTSASRYAVSSKTSHLVRALDRDVTFYMFLPRYDPSYDELREVIRKYESMSAHIRLEIIDRDREPVRYQAVAQKYALSGGVEDGADGPSLAMAVVAGERVHKLAYGALFERRFGFDEQDNGTSVKIEQALTSGIVAVTSGQKTRLCLTTGHGEWTRTGGGERSFEAVAQSFATLDNVEFEDFELTPSSEIPATCHALFILGPQRLFEEAIGAKLETYVKGGGRVLIAADPLIDERDGFAPTGLEPMLDHFGIELGRDVVFEPSEDHRLPTAPFEAIVVRDFGEHVLTSALAERSARLHLMEARSVSVKPGSSAVSLLRASPKSYAETDLSTVPLEGEPKPGTGDVPGPVGLAAAWASSDEPGASSVGRIVVLGDTDAFSPSVLEFRLFANYDFMSAVTGWLTDRNEMITIAPRFVPAATLHATRSDLFGLVLRVLVLIPLAFGLLGLSVWWSRKA